MSKCLFFLHLILIQTFTSSAWSQEVHKVFTPEFKANYTSRYFKLKNDDSDTEKIQGALTIDLGTKIGKKFSVHSTLSQTPALGKRFYTIYDMNNNQAPTLLREDGSSILPNALFIQKLFAQFEDERNRVQVGVIPRFQNTEKFKQVHVINKSSLENGFMGTNAWVDGFRVTRDIMKGKDQSVLVTLTVGSLNEQSTRLMERTDFFNPNYAEVQINAGDCKGGSLELAGGTVDGEVFARGAIGKLIKITNKIAVELYTEALYNVTEDEVAVILGYQSDILGIFNPKLKGHLKLGMEVAYIGENIGTRGIMANDAFLPGKRFRIHLKGKVDKKGRVQWFVQKDIGSTSILSAGAKVNINKK